MSDIISPSHSLGVLARLTALESIVDHTPTVLDLVNSGTGSGLATQIELTSDVQISIASSIITQAFGTNGSNTIYRVTMRGRLQKVSGTFSTDTDLFTLPLAIRPQVEQNFVALGHLGPNQVRIDIAPGNGIVKVSSGGTDSNTQFVNLGNISFWAGI